MKHIKLFENYTKDQIKRMLQKAQKNSDVDIKIDIDELIDKNLKNTPQFGFEGFVEQEGRFISASDQMRMGEYIDKFKELGLDTTEAEKLYPKQKRYVYLQYKEEDNIYDSGESDAKKNANYKKLADEMNRLQPFIDKFDKIVRELAKKAKEIL
jgi:hypothetical protein